MIMEKLPELKIHENRYTLIEDPYFKHSVGGMPIEERTEVRMRYDTSSLHIHFECRDNPRMDQNFYTEDNSPIYNQEVFEVFISQGSARPKEYIEIQLNPNNALYVSKISYGVPRANQFKIELLDIAKSGIVNSVSKNREHNSWSGELSIPLDLISNGKKGSNEVFRFNLFRVISKEDHLNPDWVLNSKNGIYSCWSSTYQKEPQFHVPERFGFLYLL